LRVSGQHRTCCSEHLDFGWVFTALAWTSVTLAPALAWIFVGLAVLEAAELGHVVVGHLSPGEYCPTF